MGLLKMKVGVRIDKALTNHEKYMTYVDAFLTSAQTNNGGE